MRNIEALRVKGIAGARRHREKKKSKEAKIKLSFTTPQESVVYRGKLSNNSVFWEKQDEKLLQGNY